MNINSKVNYYRNNLVLGNQTPVYQLYPHKEEINSTYENKLKDPNDGS